MRRLAEEPDRGRTPRRLPWLVLALALQLGGLAIDPDRGGQSVFVWALALASPWLRGEGA